MCAACVAMLAAARTLVPTAVSPPADLVLLNARVITLDPASPGAEAAAVRDGRFVAVGARSEVQRLVGPGTRLIDAGGRVAIPGLIDSHVHALGVAGTEAREPFSALRSVADVQTWVRAAAGRAPAGSWLWTPRVFPTRVRERRFPTRQELDAASPDHPVVVDGAYALVLNSAALSAAGITRETADPQGGSVEKDARGEPTGLLRNAASLLAAFAPPGSEEPPLETLAAVHRQYNAVGITSVTERAASLRGYEIYDALRRTQGLRVRATVTLRVESDGTAEGTERFIRNLPLTFGAGDEWLRVGPLKIVADGGILAGSSFMRAPYGRDAAALYGIADPAFRGRLTLSAHRIEQVVRIGHRLGWQMAAHVTGDAGVDAVLDAVEAADRDRPIRDRRFTLIHAYFPHAETARRAARLGVVVDTQPAWLYRDADALVAALGERRMQLFIGVAEWLRAGVMVALNTDHMFGLDPAESLNPFLPFLTMQVAVTRRSEGGREVGADQAVSREQALRMMTLNAAYLGFDEREKGSIEVGKLGDFAVLSDDLLSCPVERIRDIRVLWTVVGGRVVHQAAQP